MKLIFWIVLLSAVSRLAAQTKVANFSLSNVVDGSTVSLEGQSRGVVIIFKSNVCPYDGYYIERIRSLVATYQGRIQFLLVNSFQEPEETAALMKTSYAGWNLSVPYLADKEQVAMNALGAKRSPEAFLLRRDPGGLTIVYNGAIDDNPQVAAAVTQPFLQQAIVKMLAGQTIEPTSVRAAGCSIRRK